MCFADENPSNDVQVGIVSFGPTTCTPSESFFSVYTRVASDTSENSADTSADLPVAANNAGSVNVDDFIGVAAATFSTSPTYASRLQSWWTGGTVLLLCLIALKVVHTLWNDQNLHAIYMRISVLKDFMACRRCALLLVPNLSGICIGGIEQE